MQKLLLLFLFLLATTFSITFAQTCDLDFEDWENATNANPPTGWQRIDSYVGTAAGNSYSGSKFAGMNTLDDQWVVEPLTCPGEICFYWRASGGSSNYDVDIDWSTDNGTTWTTAHTIALTGSGSPTTYAQECVDLPEASYNAPFTGILVRFNMSRRVGGSFYFDDVCMSSGVCTVVPTQLTFTNLQGGCLQKNTPFSMTICATDAGENIDNTYSFAITVADANLSGMTTQTAINGCVQFTDLQISTAGNYTLSATSGGLSGMSNSITIEDLCPLTSSLKVVAYNLLNFPNGRDDCGTSNTVVPARWDTLGIIMDYVQPDVLMVCELQTEAGADMILSNALNIGGRSNYARANFVLNQSSGGTALNNAFFYNTDKMTFYSQDEVSANVRDIGEYTVFLNDPNLAIHQDTVFIDFYTAHLKAGSAAADISNRENQCNSLQNHTSMNTAERNAIVGGDFNFYDSAEAGYQALLGGTYPFNDPISTPGSWDNGVTFSGVHTQATRSFNTDPLDCGATGGMDSRFDFLLNSNSIMSGTKNVAYVANSYQALGNSGNLFNDAINDPANSSGVPGAVLSALRNGSDHLPVLMELDVTFPQVALPFDLLSFTAKNEEGIAVIEWEVADEREDLDFFTLQRSIDKRSFYDVVHLEKIEETTYSYSEKLNSGTTYYRLKSTEIDGTVSYSKVESLTEKGTSWAIFPNPVRDVLQVKTLSDISSNNNTIVTIYDALGRVVFGQNAEFENALIIQTGAWHPGVYLVEIVNGGERVIYRVVK